MNLLNVRRLTPGIKAMLVLCCGIMTGFMWRVRGSHGWGSMWGMFAVGVMLVLFIFAFFGNRKKMSLEAIPIAVILLGITNGGWGTLNSQMGGYLQSTVPFAGQEAGDITEISAGSGMAIMLLLGFGWMPLFAMFIGSLFSKKQYKIWHYIVLIAVFYVVVYGFQFFVAHYILPYVSPQAVESFKLGLADSGHEMSPMMAYIKNLGNEAWFKKIPYGRNYFASIRVISYSAGALVLSLATLIAKKDAVTSFISFAINAICAVSITLADIVMVIDSDRGFFAAGKNIPRFLQGSNWSLWEFLTGFLLGFGIMLLLVCLPKRITGGEGDFDYELPLKNNKLYAAYSAVMTLFATFVLTVARPAGMRISELVLYKGWSDNEDLITYISIAVLCVIGIIPCAIIAKKNVIKRDLPNLFNERTEDFCLKAIPAYIFVTAVLYFLLGDSAIYFAVPFAEIKSFASFAEMIRSGQILIPAIMVVSFVVFNLFYLAVSKKAVKKK
mgnify:CR=1 FL=1